MEKTVYLVAFETPDSWKKSQTVMSLCMPTCWFAVDEAVVTKQWLVLAK